jgi:hypothetical protein
MIRGNFDIMKALDTHVSFFDIYDALRRGQVDMEGRTN